MEKQKQGGKGRNEAPPKIPSEFLGAYNPADFEDGIYTLWEDSGFFNPDVCVEKGVTARDAEPFSIVLPPPNVTGTLHIGHAYEDSLQDALVRFARMHGKKTLWIPGTDSAAIATQARVEKNIREQEGKTRHDLGREELVRRVREFAKASESTILNQVRKMGASLDWSRYAYTLDERRTRAVATAFARMYEAGLIYRGHRIVNWDPASQTTISDDEIVYKEETAKFYYFKYGPFVISTARPETKFGDKYVVVHPTDARYAEYEHSQKIELEWINGPITATVIKDEAADPETGSGAMTITPWHSVIDFEIAERHSLDKEQIIDQRGKLLPIAGEFAGMKITDAREKIVEKLQQKGLVVKIEENYTHNIATSERTGATIEPQIMEQWFVAVNKPFALAHSDTPGIASGETLTLRELMRTVVESGAVAMPQEGFRSAYFHWIDNLRDWCISRQIWFGHRIPVWCHDKKCVPIPGREAEVARCILTVVSETKPNCAHCAAEYSQDPDVLDTWFSSALWTFSTLGWPEETSDLQTFHPTSFMSPAYEILFLWISRMILMSGFHLGQAPFRVALIHGLVRDSKGRNFSKSLGNGIDPLDMIATYGADALRMGLLAGTAIGNDIPFDENKVRGYKHFANKLWNIARFVLSNIGERPGERPTELPERDAEILAALDALAVEITTDLDAYRLHLAAEKIYHYIWHALADKILEESKPILSGGGETDAARAALRAARAHTLSHCLTTSLKLLHPFMPFVTETIWQRLPQELKTGEHNLLMVAKWPTVETPSELLIE